MDEFAKASEKERSRIFTEAYDALRPIRSIAIIEKDFWVCWTLHRIFEAIPNLPKIIFKGGTSLSKAYGVIERFSEDVDLSLSKESLGMGKGQDPEEPGISNKEAVRRIEKLVERCQEAIRSVIVPALQSDFAHILGKTGWSVTLDPNEPQTVLFKYPLSAGSDSIAEEAIATQPIAGRRTGKPYISTVIRLEMGARSDDWPAEDRIVRPYVAEVFPEAFTSSASCQVHTLMMVRTFWEKVTILHGEYHRTGKRSEEYQLTRHFYDIYRLSKQKAIMDEAFQQLKLLERVVQHKNLFFKRPWARYDLAKPGSIHLIPPKERMPGLRTDYEEMATMIFGPRPAWDEIIDGLTKLEQQINALKNTA